MGFIRRRLIWFSKYFNSRLNEKEVANRKVLSAGGQGT